MNNCMHKQKNKETHLLWKLAINWNYVQMSLSCLFVVLFFYIISTFKDIMTHT